MYFDKFYTAKSLTKIENLVGILSSGLLCYLFSFPSMNKPLYLNQYSHPHPIIRTLNIINQISGYAVHLVKSKGVTGFEPNKENIIKIALEVGEELAASMLPGVPFQKFVGELKIHLNEVAVYINDLEGGVEGMERSAVRVRNGNL